VKRQSKHVLNLIPVVDQNDISADDRVPVAARGGTVLEGQVRGQGVHLAAQLRIQPPAALKPRLHARGQAIPLSPASAKVTLIPLVPIARDLAIMVIERLALLIGLDRLAVRLIGHVPTLAVRAIRILAGCVWPAVLSTVLRYGCFSRHDEECKRQCASRDCSGVHELVLQ
jgi:hypothetical protein